MRQNYISTKRGVASDSITRPSNTTAYAAGDVVSEVTTNDHLTFSLANLTSGFQVVGTGKIESARCMINANQATKPDLELWLFDTDIAEVADNSAFAPTDTEILTLVGVIDFAVANFKVGLAGSGAAGNIVQQINNLDIPYKTAGDNQNGNLYGQLVVRNAYTPISAELFHVELVVAQD